MSLRFNTGVNVLLLGVVDSNTQVAGTGQEYRDKVRVGALRELGYFVKTLDEKHDREGLLPQHCCTNFCDARRAKKSMENKWGEGLALFDDVILDYYFSPDSWARERWSAGFFIDTIPMFARMMTADGKIWLPHNQSVQDNLRTAAVSIAEDFDTIMVGKDYLHINPLYLATDGVNEELEQLPDNRTNHTQMQPYLAFSDEPFIVLQKKLVLSVYPTFRDEKNRLVTDIN